MKITTPIATRTVWTWRINFNPRNTRDHSPFYHHPVSAQGREVRSSDGGPYSTQQACGAAFERARQQIMEMHGAASICAFGIKPHQAPSSQPCNDEVYPNCPDCGTPLFRSNQTDGFWMCGKCDETKTTALAAANLPRTT